MPPVCFSFVDGLAVALQRPQIFHGPHAVKLPLANMAAGEMKFLKDRLVPDLLVEGEQFTSEIAASVIPRFVNMPVLTGPEHRFTILNKEIAQSGKRMDLRELMRTRG